MKQYFPASILPALLLFACSDHVQVVNSPGPKRISSPVTRSAPVAGVANPIQPADSIESVPDSLFVVSGRVQNPKGIPLGSGARVAGFWVGDVGEGDFAYVFGSGEIDQEAGTFRMTFHAEPPDSASFGGIFGVGALILVDAPLEEGLLPDGFFDSDAILGASPRHYVIFNSRDPELLENVPWLEPFPQGYSVGRGIQIPDFVFDGFEPADPDSVEIIIDDLENLDFVNWS